MLSDSFAIILVSKYFCFFFSGR